MLMQEPSPEMIRTWKETYDTFRTRLQPSNKQIPDVIAYLIQKYPVTELTEESIKQVVSDNVVQNECYAKKSRLEKPPCHGFFK